MNKIPEKIKIGPHNYNIVVIKEAMADAIGINGDTNLNMHRIRICESLKGSVLLEVLLHEILHAIYKQYSLEQKDKEERIVMSFGLGLTQVFVDNPDLLKFIQKNVNETR